MTTDLTAELTARIQELLADELVILAEAEDGASVPWATRPLSDAEQRSGVRFGEIHGIQERLLEAVAPVLASLSATTVQAVVSAAGRGAKRMLATLAQWRVQLPAPVAAEVAKAVPVVEGALAESFRASSRLVVAEAARQGVKLAPVVEAPVWTRELAETVVEKPVAKVLDVARELHTAPSAIVTPPTPEAVEAALTDVSPKGPVDAARQANNAVVNEGRFSTWEANERKPDWYYASELADGHSCGACIKIDGTEWSTLEEVRKHYPGGGGYIHCEGKSRCRGTAVGVYRG